MDKDIRSVTEKGEILYVVSLAFLYWLRVNYLVSLMDGPLSLPIFSILRLKKK